MRISFQHHIGLVILIYDGMRRVRSKDQPTSYGQPYFPPDGFYRIASSIVDIPQQGQDDAENMITADAGGVVSFRKTGVMQTIQYEMLVASQCAKSGSADQFEAEGYLRSGV